MLHCDFSVLLYFIFLFRTVAIGNDGELFKLLIGTYMSVFAVKDHCHHRHHRCSHHSLYQRYRSIQITKDSPQIALIKYLN